MLGFQARWRNMNRLREILLTQHIGAVAIGLVAGQILMGLVNTVVQTGAAYFATRQSESVLGQRREFSWQTPILSLISISLEILICIALIRWLYTEPNVSAPEVPNGEDGLPNEQA